MKKLMTILLTLVLLLSAFAGVAIAGSAAAADTTNITVTINQDDPDNVVAVLSSGDLTGDDLVNAVKTALTGKSTGNRYITLNVREAFLSVVQDDVFFDAGIEPIRTALDTFLKKLISVGVQLDGIKTSFDIMTNKDISPSSWYLRSRNLLPQESPKNSKIYIQIVENPLYNRYIRPLLVDRGFVFETNASYADCEIYGIRPYVAAAVADKLKNCPTIWDSVMYYNLTRYLKAAVETPLLENYPEAEVGGLYVVKYSEYFSRDKATANPGETVTLNLTKVPSPTNDDPKEKEFYKWSVSLGSASVEFADQYNPRTTFVMPAGNVIITPIFKYVGEAAPESYEVTIGGDGICDFGAGSYAPGTKVTVSCGVAPAGMMLDKWILPANVVLDEGCTEESSSITFTMPSGNVQLKTTFKVDDRPPVKDPTVSIIDGGDGFSGQGEYMIGTKVTINAGTREGYVFAGWKCEDKKIELGSPSSTKTTFSINEEDVVLTATWKKIEAPAEGTTPFYLVNWASSEGVTNVFDLPFFWSPRTIPADGEMMQVKYNNSYDIKEIAKMLKAHFDKRPEGTRYFNLTAWQGMAQEASRAENVVFMDNGGQIIAEWLEAFLTEYKAIGGKLDGIVTDMEYFDPLSWYLNTKHYKDGTGVDIYTQIVNDPRYATEIRPLLEERGFKFYEVEGVSELYSIYPRLTDEDYARSRSIWDAVTRTRLNQYITKYVYEPVAKFYPEAEVSDYQGRSMDAWNKETEYDGSNMFVGGNREYAGNNSNINFYLHRPSNAYYENLSTKPYGFNSVYYAETPFSAALWEFNVFKNLYKAADGHNISTWIAYYDYHAGEMGDESANRIMSGTAYYSEVLFHIGLLNPKPFIGFIVPGGTTDGMYAGSGEDYIRRVRVASDCLEELTRIVGASDREPILVPTTWNDGYLLSGMYAGGKNYWRITPDTTHTSLTEFRVKDAADPTFTIGGKTVTFPGGRIIEDGHVSEIGTCGYWVETATDVYPVFSYDENRYENYPAYMETYNSYFIGTEYVYENANPNKAWEFSKKQGALAMIKRDPTNFSNNMLGLSGNITLKNVTIPQNITAGDNYAKQQAWEITFYLPEDLAADAEVTMLNTVKKDGLKVVNGKLYYYGEDDFVELATLPLGAKYTVKRVLDFRTPKAFTTDYFVYDAEGKEIAKVSGVSAKKVTIPVEAINFGVTNVTGGPVLFDDYKLYALGVTTDLEIYNAKTGILFADQTVAHAEESAYRLSWMNASKETQKATIVSTCYDADGNVVSEEIIKDIEMMPGADGVEAGIAKKNADGTTQLITLRMNYQAPEEPPVEPEPTAKDINLPLIIGIAGGAVVLIAVLVVLLIVLKKKKTA